MILIDLIRAIGRKVFGCNLHAVEDGRVYRVARGRIGTPEFMGLLRELGVRTAVDLRRAKTSLGDELKPADFEEAGVRFENVHLRSSALPFPSKLSRFVEILDGIEYPVLFYCKRGTDKTGFASMLYLILVKEAPLAEARKQLALIPFGHKKRRHEGPWHFMRLAHDNGAGKDLRAWIRDDYPALFRKERPEEADEA